MKRLFLLSIFIIMIPGITSAQDYFTLNDCINVALENNTQVKNAKLSIGTSKALKLASYSSILPNISFSASPSRSFRAATTYLGYTAVGINSGTGQVIYGKREVTSPSNVTKNYSTNISLSQNVWDNGRWWNRIRQAESNLKATEMSFDASKLNTVALVKSRYFDLVKVLAQRQVREESVTLAEEQLRQSEIMYDIGTVAQVDVYRSKVNLDRSKINLINHDLMIENAKHNLNISMGRDPNDPVNINTNINLDVNYDLDLEALVNRGYSSNPEITRSDYLINSSALGLKIAKADRFPVLRYSASYSRSNSDLDRIYEDVTKNYNLFFNVSLSYTLFDGFQRRANIQQATNDVEINRENLNDTKRNLKSNIVSYYNQLMAFRQKIEINNEMIAAAEEDLRLANERYRVGSGTLIETIDAQVQLTSAKYTLLESQYDALIAEANLLAAIGDISGIRN
ncbi:TolC family protein [candidate division KSB1 bacterium]